MEAFDFQRRGVQAVIERVESDAVESVALVAPTGSGKTSFIGAALLRYFLDKGLRVLWNAPGPQLVEGAATALLRAGFSDLGVWSSGFSTANRWSRLSVSSVWTVASQTRRLHPMVPQADVVVWDECHRLAARTFGRVRDEVYGDAKHIGLTATLYGQRGSLSGLFDEVIALATPAEMVELGIITPARVVCPPNDSAPALLDKYGKGQAALVFCASKNRAKDVGDAVERSGRKAALVFDDTSMRARRRAYRAIDDGSLDVIVGCGTFVDGVDFQLPSVVLFADGVTSRRKAFQAIGRARRASFAGKVATVIDPHRSMSLHGLPDDASQQNGAKSKELRVCSDCFVLGRGKDCEECFSALL